MKRLVCTMLFLVGIYTTTTAQSHLRMGADVTFETLGDGRVFFRLVATNKPLQGQHRIYDNRRNEYFDVVFHDGFYDGRYRRYVNQRLCEERDFRRGVRYDVQVYSSPRYDECHYENYPRRYESVYHQDRDVYTYQKRYHKGHNHKHFNKKHKKHRNKKRYDD